ncbi:biosynthetic peptidoglycan transglycosylase [Pseudonocardia endophytica]|uniref:Monofunctional biosynthetic peptidoglycan transglycosylase n=1 Tax=Pseudonocardia endophytica TaxID=401976 RepID=A0A4R1HYG6_PSEEN|nr:biosynthetic peptidoglycan transglycosylase [Pseudonocardia endophytica]TCK27864.1 monofunctional biosynthetic peptidoglycan transglycosylase [Pseudonocardia endophytica]
MWTLLIGLLFDGAAEAYFLSLGAFDPPFTTYMLAGGSFINDHVDLEYVNLYMVNATLAHEDAELPDRFTGLDWSGFAARGIAFAGGHKDPAGSPIPEQLSKNLLLWSSQDPLRKGLDAILAEQLVHAVSKQRVLELYLNVAQFGPHLYGVCDASWYYFDHAPDRLTKDESAQLMGVLPGPIHTHRAPGGGIDMNPNDPDGWYELKKIRGARDAVAYEIAQNGGDLELARRLGLTEPASQQPDGSGSCRTMPSDVADMIKNGE